MLLGQDLTLRMDFVMLCYIFSITLINACIEFAAQDRTPVVQEGTFSNFGNDTKVFKISKV